MRVYGIGAALLTAATIAILLANPNVQAGDRVVVVNGPDQILTGPQKTAMGGAITALWGIPASSIDTFWCRRDMSQDCQDHDANPATPNVCTDVETIRCEAVDLATVTPEQRQAHEDASRHVELLSHANGNDDIKITYHVATLTAGQRTGLNNWLNSVFSKGVDLTRAFGCHRNPKQPAQVLCNLTDIRTVSALEESQLLASRSIVEKLPVVVGP
jgi:hypothetical protein